MDVKKVLKNAGTSVMSSAVAQGQERAKLAIEAALNSPLLNNRDIRGAERILITLASSTKEEYMATLDEQMAITDYIEELIGDEADMCKVGVIFDDSLDDQLLVTVIAAGFSDSHLPFKYDSSVSKKENTPPATPLQNPSILGVNAGMNKGENSPTGSALPNNIPIETPSSSQPISVAYGYKRPEESPSLPVPLKEAEVTKPSITISATQLDAEILQGLIKDIGRGHFSVNELEIPAYLRQKVVLLEKPILPPEGFVFIKLDKHKR